MSKSKIVVTRRWPAEIESELKQHFDVTLNGSDTPLSPAELQMTLKTHDGVFTTVTDAITETVLSADPLRAKLIGNFGAGRCGG